MRFVHRVVYGPLGAELDLPVVCFDRQTWSERVSWAAMPLRSTTLTRAIGLAALLAAGGCGEDPVSAGKRFVGERGCADCHRAPDGTLSGQAAPRPGTTAYPPNLTPDRATGLGDWADVTIVRAMRFGVDDEQRPLCAPMPRFDGSDPARPYLGDVEGDAIVAYLRSLAPVVRTDIPESRCPERGTTP